MNKEEIFSIVSQGLNIANTKGAFNLDESAMVQKALVELKQILTIKEETNDSVETK
jgi:hypothetical protein